MRGIQRLKPPKTKLFPSWELVTVLKLLMSWGETKELLLRKPIIKTAFLVAVICVMRPGDLCNMQVVENYWGLNKNRFIC